MITSCKAGLLCMSNFYNHLNTPKKSTSSYKNDYEVINSTYGLKCYNIIKVKGQLLLNLEFIPIYFFR